MAPRTYRVGRKIAVYGNSGSGKTTVGRELGRKLGVPYIELDSIFHYRPRWEDRETEDFREQVRLLLEQHTDGWVFDGNYSVVRELILGEADTAVWLELPFPVVYFRLAWRTISRAARRQPLWNGNEETLKQTFLTKDSMLLWGITSWRRSRRNTAQALRQTPHNAAIHVLRSPREVRGFLASVPPREGELRS
jgi:adenylate kinase family enzyme